MSWKSALFRTFSRLIRKRENFIIFISTPDYADNPQSLSDYLLTSKSGFDCRWIVSKQESLELLEEKGVLCALSGSWKSLLWLAKARVVVTSHMQFLSLVISNQIYLNLWHGIPIKQLGGMRLDSSFSNESKTLMRLINREKTVTTSTSITESTVLGACHYIHGENFALTGQPRCDRLFHPLKLEVVKKLVDSELSASDDFLMYMPTFRCGEPGKSDNAHRKIHNIFGFSTIDTASLNAFLESNNLLLLLKLHPFEEEILKDSIEDYGSRVLMISNISLLRHSVDLYSLLASVTLLITDYSSVYFDYLLLNRPMVFTPTDLEEYEKKRGFLLGPYDFWTPGPKATNQEQLQDEILKSLENPEYYRKERETINSIMNHYKDDRSCERVTHVIMEKLNRKNDKSSHYSCSGNIFKR